MKKTKRLGSQGSTNKNFVISLVLAILLVSTISAFEFDNVKSYDVATQTATINNAFGLPNFLGGYEIAEIPLKSAQHEMVGLGYQKVFEYEINSYTDYKEFIQGMEIYNQKTGKQEDKKIDLKFLELIEVDVYDEKPICSEGKNGTDVCIFGTHKELRETWKDLSSMDIKIGKLTISGWTNVNQGDYYEWIPQFAGVQVSEWATWSGNLSTSLTDYWKFDESSGNAVNSINTSNNGVLSSASYVAGKIGNAVDMSPATDYVDMGYPSDLNTVATINFWVKPNINVAGFPMSKDYSGTNAGDFNFQMSSSGVMKMENRVGSTVFTSNTSFTNITWQMVTVTWDGTNSRMYINGVITAKGSNTEGILGSAGGKFQLNHFGAGVDGIIATYDELGIWLGRELTYNEIILLYNAGTGCQHGNEYCYSLPDASPTITLNNPSDLVIQRTQTTIFNCTGADDIKVQNISFIINNSYNQTNSSPLNNTLTSFTEELADGYYSWKCEVCDNATSPQCVNATARTFYVNTTPVVYAFSPENITYTTPTVYFNATSDLGIDQWIVNYNGTNKTLASINSTVTVEDGYFNLRMYGRNTETLIYGENSSRNFTVDTTPVIYTFSPTNTTYNTSTIYFNGTSSLAVDTWIVNYNGTNTTLPAINTTLNVEDGYFNLRMYGRNTETLIYGENSSRNFTVDTTPPTILVTDGNETQTYWNFSQNYTLNYTVTDTNLDSCWIDYNGTNTSIGCETGIGNYTNFTLQLGVNNATLWANDTANNTYSRYTEWNYRMLYMNESYTTPIFEGVSSTFALNLYTNGTDITIARLNYNGTDYFGTVTNNGGNFFTMSKTMNAPVVSADANATFFWNTTQSVFGNYNFTQHNQTVLNFNIDNCSTNTLVVYNFTLKDEDSQTTLNTTGNNTLAEVNFQLYNYASTTLIQELNKQYNQTNPFAICINKTLTTEQFSADLQIRHSATNWETEYYHLQNATINLTNLNQNISLYDLNSSRSQEFEITYRDSAYVPVANVLINISRKYIDEGIFKVVEIPKTDAAGKAPAHLVLNDVVYTITIMQYGRIIQTYNNVYAVCQTPLVSTCKIDLVQSLGSVDVSDFSDNEDFNYTMYFNETSRIITSVFTIPSGIPANTSLLVTQENALGTSVCIDYLNSTSGTLSCTLPATIGNSTVRATLYKDGSFRGWGSVKLDQKSSDLYGGIVVILSVLVLVTIMGVGLSNNPIVTLVFVGIGAIVLFGLNLVSNTGFIGGTATILWLFIVIILVLIKGAKRN